MLREKSSKNIFLPPKVVQKLISGKVGFLFFDIFGLVEDPNQAINLDFDLDVNFDSELNLTSTIDFFRKRTKETFWTWTTFEWEQKFHGLRFFGPIKTSCSNVDNHLWPVL